MHTAAPVRKRRTWSKAPPVSYLGRARSFLTAARILNEHHKNDFTPYLACCGQATELALKAYLVHKAVPEASLIRKPGHNLQVAWEMVIDKGVALGTLPLWCKCLNDAHAHPYDARYPRVNILMGLPDSEVMLSGIDALIDAMQEAIKSP